MKFGPPWIGTGPPPTRMTSRRSIKIYRDDAVLDYPQSGERIRGRRQHPAVSHSAAEPESDSTCVGSSVQATLWITEFVLTYDGRPSYTVSIMEFAEAGKVVRETQYFSRSLRAWAVARSMGLSRYPECLRSAWSTTYRPLARLICRVDTVALARYLIGKRVVARELPEGVASAAASSRPRPISSAMPRATAIAE